MLTRHQKFWNDFKEDWSYMFYNLIKENDKIRWRWRSLSANPNFTFSFIEKNLFEDGFHWNINGIAERDDVPTEFIRKYMYKWSYSFSMCKNLTLDLLLEFPDENWRYDYLSYNQHIDIEYISDFIDKGWDWGQLSLNANISIQDVKDNIEFPWHWSGLSSNKNIKFQDILNNLDLKWNWFSISGREFVNMELLLQHPSLPWDWSGISKNKNIKLIDIENHPEMPWDIEYLSSNKNLTINFVKKHLDWEWDWESISSNNNIQMIDVRQNPDFDWCDYYLTWNTNIDIQIIEYIIERRGVEHMCFDEIFSCPNLSMDFVNKYYHKLTYYSGLHRNGAGIDGVSRGKFTVEREKYLVKKVREYLAVYKIKEFWKKCYYDPKTKIGKKRLEREYDKLFN